MPRTWNVSGIYSLLPKPRLSKGPLAVGSAALDSPALWAHCSHGPHRGGHSGAQQGGPGGNETCFVPRLALPRMPLPNATAAQLVTGPGLQPCRGGAYWRQRPRHMGKTLSRGAGAGRDGQTWPSGSVARAEPAGRGRAGKEEKLQGKGETAVSVPSLFFHG